MYTAPNEAYAQQSASLGEAVLSNNEFTVKNYLRRHEVERKELNSSLELAVARALSPEIISVLLSAGANPHRKDSKANSLLITAMTLPVIAGADAFDSNVLIPLGPRRLALLKMLLQLKVDPNVKSPNGTTPLVVAAKRGEYDAVKLLLRFKANPHLGDNKQRTPLYYAAKGGFIKVVELLLDSQANPDASDIRKRTPLMAAAENGSIDCVRMLAKAGADINAKDEDGATAVALASKKGHRQAASLLRRLGGRSSKIATIPAGGPLNNPFTALSTNNIAALKSMVARGINLEQKNASGNTPLLEACKLDRLLSSRILINGGAKVNVRSPSGWTPLMYAAQKGNHALARDLLAAGASTEAVNPQGMSAMALAEKHGYMDVAVYIRRFSSRGR